MVGGFANQQVFLQGATALLEEAPPDHGTTELGVWVFFAAALLIVLVALLDYWSGRK